MIQPVQQSSPEGSLVYAQVHPQTTTSSQLTLQFLPTSELAILLVQDPPQLWLTEKFLGRFKIFVPTGPDSLTAILLDQKLQASLMPLGATYMCVVRVGVGRDSVIFFLGYVQPVTGVGCANIGRALHSIGGASLR